MFEISKFLILSSSFSIILSTIFILIYCLIVGFNLYFAVIVATSLILALLLISTLPNSSTVATDSSVEDHITLVFLVLSFKKT